MTHPSATSRCADPFGWRTSITANDSTQQEETMGVVRTEYDQTYGMCKYLYVKNNSGTAINDGNVVGFTGKIYDGKVSKTCNRADFTAGVAFGSITASYFGWIQILGYHDAVQVDSSGLVAAKSMLCMCSDSASYGCAVLNGGSTLNLGISVAADTTTSVEAYISVATVL